MDNSFPMQNHLSSRDHPAIMYYMWAFLCDHCQKCDGVAAHLLTRCWIRHSVCTFSNCGYFGASSCMRTWFSQSTSPTGLRAPLRQSSFSWPAHWVQSLAKWEHVQEADLWGKCSLAHMLPRRWRVIGAWMKISKAYTKELLPMTLWYCWLDIAESSMLDESYIGKWLILAQDEYRKAFPSNYEIMANNGKLSATFKPAILALLVHVVESASKTWHMWASHGCILAPQWWAAYVSLSWLYSSSLPGITAVKPWSTKWMQVHEIWPIWWAKQSSEHAFIQAAYMSLFAERACMWSSAHVSMPCLFWLLCNQEVAHYTVCSIKNEVISRVCQAPAFKGEVIQGKRVCGYQGRHLSYSLSCIDKTRSSSYAAKRVLQDKCKCMCGQSLKGPCRYNSGSIPQCL